MPVLNEEYIKNYLKKIYLLYKEDKIHWQGKSLINFLSKEIDPAPKDLNSLSIVYKGFDFEQTSETKPKSSDYDLYQAFRTLLHYGLNKLGILRLEKIYINALGFSDLRVCLSKNHLTELTLKSCKIQNFDFLEGVAIKYFFISKVNFTKNLFADLIKHASAFVKIKITNSTFWEDPITSSKDFMELTQSKQKLLYTIIIKSDLPKQQDEQSNLYISYKNFVKKLPYLPLIFSIDSISSKNLWINKIITAHNDLYIASMGENPDISE